MEFARFCIEWNQRIIELLKANRRHKGAVLTKGNCMPISKWLSLVQELFHLPTIQSLNPKQTHEFLFEYIPPHWSFTDRIRAQDEIVNLCVIYK